MAEVNSSLANVELNSFILSHVFWPSFKSNEVKPPEEIQKLV